MKKKTNPRTLAQYLTMAGLSGIMGGQEILPGIIRPMKQRGSGARDRARIAKMFPVITENIERKLALSKGLKEYSFKGRPFFALNDKNAKRKLLKMSIEK